MKHTTIPWALPGQSTLSSDSRRAGITVRVADFTTRALVPRPLTDRAEGPAGMPKGWKGGSTAHGQPALSAAPRRLKLAAARTAIFGEFRCLQAIGQTI